MLSHTHDRALSEVIGFILILGLLTVIMGLYVAYVVPSEGRDAEIAHLDYIKQQFLNYKLSTDALWVNKAEGSSITQSIQLGTQGATSGGMFANFALLQPVGSGGMLSVNSPDRRERLVVEASGLIGNDPIQFGVNRNPRPVISYISPASIHKKDSGMETINIVGNGFIRETEVYYNNEQITSNVNVVDAGHMSFSLENKYLREPGFGRINVFNGEVGGGESKSVSFTILNTGDNLVPVLRSVSGTPDPVRSGSTTLIISGDFNDKTLPNWDGKIIDSVSYSVSDIQENGYVIVSLTNLTPGGGTSNGIPVYVKNSTSDSIPPKIDFITPAKVSSKNSVITIFGSGFKNDCSVFVDGVSKKSSTSWLNESAVSYTVQEDLPDLYSISVKNIADAKTSNSINLGEGTLSSANPYAENFLNMTPSHFFLSFTSKEQTSFYDNNSTLTDFIQQYGIEVNTSKELISARLNAARRIITATYRITDSDKLTDLTDKGQWDEAYDDELLSNDARYNIYYVTDLLLSIMKGEHTIVDNLTIESEIKEGQKYTIDLLDPFYGLNPESFFGSTITLKLNGGTSPEIEYSIISGLTETGYNSVRNVGGLEYFSKNYYYPIQQNFIYQNGGIYVNQSSGQSPVVLPPISISRVDNNVLVKVIDIGIIGDDQIGGSSPIQITTALDSLKSISSVINSPNAKSVIIGIDPMNSWNQVLWRDILKAIYENAIQNGVPSGWMVNTSDPPRLVINGNPGIFDPDIIFEHVKVDNTIDLQAVGKAVTTT